MPVKIEITYRDAEVSSRTRQLVFAHAPDVREFADFIDVCHVIIRQRGSSWSNRSYAVSIDLVGRDNRIFAACLRDRHVYFDSLEDAVDEAFRELKCWLREVAPTWRNKPRKASVRSCTGDSAPLDPPVEWGEPHVMRPTLVGPHHFVG